MLRERDFASYTPAEFVEARRLMADLRLVGARGRRGGASRRGRTARPICAAPFGGRCERVAKPVAPAFNTPGTRGPDRSCCCST